jgi:adenine-specific DNA methylase
VAVLLNKVVLEYIPKYGQQLADEVRKWGQWIKDEAEKELSEFYPKDEDGSTPIAYLWARTIISEAPDDGSGIPVEVPLMRSLWLAKKKGRNRALRWLRDGSGLVKTETVAITYTDGVTRTVRRPLLEIFEPKSAKEVEDGTVKRGSGTCPVTGFTTPVASVRQQLKARRGGADDARLFCVVMTKTSEKGRFYRLPNDQDLAAIERVKVELEKRKKEHQGELSLVPDEPTPLGGGSGAGRAFSQRNYGMDKFENLFTARQSLALTTLVRLVQEVGEKLAIEKDQGLSVGVQTCLALAIDRQADKISSLGRWDIARENPQGTFARQALPIIWDFSEVNPISGSAGDLNTALGWVLNFCETNSILSHAGQVQQVNAASYSLPDDFAQCFFSDPPYYDAVPYADLSDFFYVWLKRTLHNALTANFQTQLTPKDDECIVDEVKGKDKAYFEKTMGQAMAEGCRYLALNGIGVIVFAHKSTAGWEAQLNAMIQAGWTMTGSWPIDTEMGNRLRAQNSAALASSIHLVCRPRTTNEIGDWREILQELPPRIHQWMPRLASEGVVGADAIFACLGPALEIYSRYASVERANGETVTLREYLEYVWATVSKEALGMIFDNATATDLEEDARLTAMWFWTLSTDGSETSESPEDLEEEEDDDENPSKNSKTTGFTLEYDAARKIAQGLGAYLEKLGSLVEIKGSNARLLPVAERATYLFGKEGVQEPKTKTKKAKSQQLALDFGDVINQLVEEQGTPEITVTHIGKTVLDRIHQTMLLFAAGRSEAMARFLVEDGIGADQRFWTLAQSLSALYPLGTDEKRWIDGVLARKKGLGF